jgi:excinuclease UvrABC helicase subunit UvrB
MGRNTKILEEIIEVLSLTPEHLVHLEQHFDHRLLVDVGNVESITTHAKHLRLRVEKEECLLVLDYIAQKGIVSITVDVVELAINELFGEDRFIEPER